MLYKIETAHCTYYISSVRPKENFIMCETMGGCSPVSVKPYTTPGRAEKALLIIGKALEKSGLLETIPNTQTKMYSCYADLPYLKKERKFENTPVREFVKKWY